MRTVRGRGKKNFFCPLPRPQSNRRAFLPHGSNTGANHDGVMCEVEEGRLFPAPLLTFAQLGFDLFAVGYVLNGPRHAQRSSGFIEGDFSRLVHDTLTPIWTQDAMINAELPTPGQLLLRLELEHSRLI